MQRKLRKKIVELRSESLETQANCAQQLIKDMKLTTNTLECLLGLLVQKQAAE